MGGKANGGRPPGRRGARAGSGVMSTRLVSARPPTVVPRPNQAPPGALVAMLGGVSGVDAAPFECLPPGRLVERGATGRLPVRRPNRAVCSRWER